MMRRYFYILLMMPILAAPRVAYADCPEGVCQPKPDCTAEGLTEEQCAALDTSRSRGAIQDDNHFMEPGLTYGGDSLPPNSERLLPDEKFILWVQDETLFRPQLDDQVVFETHTLQELNTVKLADRVPAIGFESGQANIPPERIEQLRAVLAEMHDRTNVRLHFIGHTDNQPLGAAGRAQYGDNHGLSAARAQIAAEFFQRQLDLPPEAVSFEGRGADEPITSNETRAGRARNRRVEVEVWYDEIVEKQIEAPVIDQPELTRVQVCRVRERCIYRRLVGNYTRIQLRNAVPPIRYEGTQVEVGEQHLQLIRNALNEVKDMPNVSVRVIGHTDNQPLAGGAARIYGDNLSLSKALASRVARVIQDTFRLSNKAVSSTGRGETAPLASNTTATGRALNRRIEIEIWHDDPRAENISEPQVCPGDVQAEMVTMVYEDDKPIIPFRGGDPVYPSGFEQRIQRILETLKSKSNVRINVVGHTTNERLSRRAAAIYGDHFGLSESRAKRVLQYLREELGLPREQLTYEGRGFLESLNEADDSPFAIKNFSLTGQEEGAVNPADARVELEFHYDELAEAQQDPTLQITRVQREEPPVSPFALHPIRVSVDGEPVDDSRLHAADIQRCIDTSLEQAQIRLRYDNLRQTPRLNVQAVPATIAFWDDPDTRVMDNKLSFKGYANYRAFISRAEVRIFEAGQSLQTQPLEILPLNEELFAEWWWVPQIRPFEGPVKELRYVLRAYDEEGRYDETAAKPLWIVNRLKSPEFLEGMDTEAEQRVAYGESHLAKQGIPVNGGTITVSGQRIPVDYSVWVMNQRVPASAEGEFVIEQIIPDGLHSVEVALLDAEGNGSLYLRDLQLKSKDWFAVGIADLTLGVDDTNGPARLVTQDETHYNSEFWADGRLAFYTKGKTEGDWTITASADSREEPIEDLFSNLDKKDPDAVFRRLDPDYYYPTFGDDSTTVEDAPTSGKFYIKAEKNKSYGMWGNFDTKIYDTDLAQVDRALYGANLHYESLVSTEYGENRTQGELFVAEPGTLLSREEFRGTGGSLYFLKKRDITQGSERLRIEVRDKDSGIVLETRTLIFAQDYDIDYIQGRILLNEPLPSTVDDGLLVQNGSLSGHPVYLVARYEYTPGFEELEDTSAGGRVSHWFGDNFKLGATLMDQEQLGLQQELSGVDITARMTPETYLKIETASSRGPAFGQTFSQDGGFLFNDFDSTVDPEESAGAHRLEAAASLDDLFDGVPGQVTFYAQEREAGFAAPGQLTNTEVSQVGATVTTPIGEKWSLYGKLDEREQEVGLSTSALEVDARYALNDNWRLSSGLRVDEREDNSLVLPLTQTIGKRSDLAFEAAYDSLADWSAYTFVQSTLDMDETREENDRVGVGGAYQVTDRLKLNAEASNGDGGSGGKLGVDYLVTDRTNLYIAYAVEPERSDTGLRGRNGRATTGFRTRYSDSLSVYGEERLLFGDQPAGLTHAYGVDFAPADRWTVGLSMEAGTLEDNETGAEIERTAMGLSAGYGSESFNYATALEWREDITDNSERQTYLIRNNLSLQLNPDWRTIAKLNISESESSLGEFYDGDFTEFVLGYAYRPVAHDRLNLLFKYTFFENLPAPEQETVTGTRADFIQRSNIISVDATYDLTQRWTLGAKLARRNGEVALERTAPVFFESNANLYIVRADWHVVRTWDWLIEARALEVEQAEDMRSGFLTAVYKHLGRNIKLGGGYNFTDFSDDLTDLDFDSQGFFINIIGKF
ncbi:MAG TPA: OmpA family protein [Gammaproteobacteria bacterium]